MRKQPFTYGQFKKIYSKVPRLTVDLLIETPRGILMTFRTLPSWHNQWHLPGGTVYFKESLEKAVRRIAQEELGITVRVKNLAGYIEYQSETKERGFGYSVSLVFVCAFRKGKVQLNGDASKAYFFSKLPKNTVQEQREFLGMFLRKR